MFFTLGAILLVIPLILLIAFYLSSAQTKSEDTLAKIRCDELHYFVEDIKSDLGRALVIFGRRAAIYAIDDVVSTGRDLDDYRLNCSSACNVDCQQFSFEMNGSEAAITELMLCGTLKGSDIDYMVNHSLSQWIDRVQRRGMEIHYNTTIGVNRIDVVQSDPFTFAIVLNSSIEVYDESGMCYFKDDGVVVQSGSSVIGLEDPLFPLNTNSFVIKFIQNCTVPLKTLFVAGCSGFDNPSDEGATGTTVFHSTIRINGSLNEYCTSQPPQKINHEILVLDQGFGGCNSYDESACFNSSHPNHFAAVLNYGPNSPESFLNKCNITIPWITDTGDIDDQWPRSPPRRFDECFERDIYEGSCIQIVNNINCGVHKVYIGCDSKEINTTCYRLSNASKYGLYDGPSFFDRLDGRLNLSEKYRNQSRDFFGTEDIGMETLVDPYLIDQRGVPVKANATWVDYLYWQWTYGCIVEGSCNTKGHYFRLDNTHADMYKMGTDCYNVPGCPDSTEVCVDSFDDDGDGLPDWLDYDCQPQLVGCGFIKECDPSDSGTCDECDTPSWAEMLENTQETCAHYGYDTSEWHFYQVTPTQDGQLRVVYNGTSNATGTDRTDLNIYNYTISGGCASQVERFTDLEPNSENTYCVLAGETYVIGLDVDATDENGSYRLGVYLDPANPACPNPATAPTTTSTTTTLPPTCGFFDDMEGGAGGWTHGGPQDEWGLGNPDWGSAKSGTNCWATDLNGDYENSANESLTSQRIDLASAAAATLRYDIKYRTESSYDFAYVEASNNGVDWSALESFSGNQNSWAERTVSISGYAGGDLYLRFRLAADDDIVRVGMYIDDVNVTCS